MSEPKPYPTHCSREACRAFIRYGEVCIHRDTKLPYCIPCARKINTACNDETLVPIVKPIMWTLEDGRALAFKLEIALADKGWHVMLGGGVLHNGQSTKDLDLAVYPRSTAEKHDMADVWKAMKALGFRRKSDSRFTRGIWERLGSKDQKTVEVYRDDARRRVDVFYFARGMFEADDDDADEICERCQERCPHRVHDEDEDGPLVITKTIPKLEDDDAPE